MKLSGTCTLYPFQVTKRNWGYVSEFHIRRDSTYMESATYAYVVSRDSVRVVLLLAALNYIYVLNAYIQVAHPNAT